MDFFSCFQLSTAGKSGNPETPETLNVDLNLFLKKTGTFACADRDGFAPQSSEEDFGSFRLRPHPGRAEHRCRGPEVEPWGEATRRALQEPETEPQLARVHAESIRSLATKQGKHVETT